MRKAFSMLTAIALIVVVSSIGAFILNLSGKMVGETTAQFQREQAMLLAKSYTEYAIMAVTANEHNSSRCLNSISGNLGGFYRIQADISYIGRNLDTSCSRRISEDITTLKSPLSIIVDVYVSYQDPDHPAGTSAPWITYHKRTLQKI
jgi:hypothetical protein